MSCLLSCFSVPNSFTLNQTSRITPQWRCTSIPLLRPTIPSSLTPLHRDSAPNKLSLPHPFVRPTTLKLPAAGPALSPRSLPGLLTCNLVPLPPSLPALHVAVLLSAGAVVLRLHPTPPPHLSFTLRPLRLPLPVTSRPILQLLVTPPSSYNFPTPPFPLHSHFLPKTHLQTLPRTSLSHLSPLLPVNLAVSPDSAPFPYFDCEADPNLFILTPLPK